MSRRYADVLRGIGAAVLLGLLITGVPTALLATGADPRRLGSVHAPDVGRIPEWPAMVWAALRWSWLGGQFVPDFLAIAAWVGWLALVTMTAIEVSTQSRHGASGAQGDLSGLRPRTWLAGIVAAVIMLASSNSASALPTPGPQAVAAVDHRPRPAAPDGEQVPRLPQYTVIHGDTLWSLAASHLGDPRRYRDIARLNAALLGGRWNHLEPGWTLNFPPDATAPPPVLDVGAQGGRAVVVAAGETLSDIAGRELGDSRRWRELFGLNVRRPQADGRALRDPDQLLPGWRILVPEDQEADQNGQHQPGVDDPGHQPPHTGGHPEPASPPANQRPAPSSPAGHWLTLPSGAIISLPLAAAIGAAAITVRARRRRRRRVTGNLHVSATSQTNPRTIRPMERAARMQTLAKAETHSPSWDEFTRPTLSPRPGAGVLIGHAEAGEQRLDLADVPGLGLTGPGASAAARAVVAAVLTADAPPHGQVWVGGGQVFERASNAPIRGGSALAAVPGVRIATSEDEILAWIESELVRRSRERADQALASELDGVQRAPASAWSGLECERGFVAPEEKQVHASLPNGSAELFAPVLIVATPSEANRLRWSALLNVARQVGLCAVVLGDGWTPELMIGADGAVRSTRGQAAGGLADSRLDSLSPHEAAEVWETLTAFRGSAEASGQEAAVPEAVADQKAGTLDGEGGVPTQATAGDKPVVIRLLGGVRIDIHGEEVSGLRRLSREALAYLAAHPAGATADRLEEDLLGDVTLANRRSQLHTAISHARSALRAAAGLGEARFVISANGRYRLDQELIDVDVWQLSGALTAARTAARSEGRIAALTAILELCRGGGPLDGTSYEWSEAAAEHWRNLAVDALVALANAEEDERPDHAIDALTIAIEWDPYTEQLYQHLIRLQIDVGRPEAAHSTLRRLRKRLAEIDATPEPATEALLKVPATPRS